MLSSTLPLAVVGATVVGFAVGFNVGALGATVVGATVVGFTVGFNVGATVVGATVGLAVGATVVGATVVGAYRYCHFLSRFCFLSSSFSSYYL